MIVAKTIIPNQFWILQENDQKIGNIEAGPNGFQVKIKDQIKQFKTIRTIKQREQINFETVVDKKPQVESNQVHGFPTTGHAHNAIYDVKHQIPLWTKEPRSKSWYAAGWYRVKLNRHWTVVQCPKLITLQRYPYDGPFMTEKETQS